MTRENKARRLRTDLPAGAALVGAMPGLALAEDTGTAADLDAQAIKAAGLEGTLP